MNTAESLFLAGQFSKVTERFCDARSELPNACDVAWITGALVFQGRVEEAKLTFRQHEAALSQTDLVCATFFLGVGAVRGAQPEEARRLFAQNLARLRTFKESNASAEFFAWQGVSFFREMSCRYALALSASRRAYDAAFLWSSPFARSLAADTRAHALIRVGRVSEGLKLLAWAQDFAGSHGLAGLAGAFGVSRLNYEAQHGRDPRGALARLVAYRDTLAVEDCYSRAALNVELARQYLLRGRGVDAKACLDEAEPFLEAHGQRRQKASLWLRRASYEFSSGAFDASHSCVERAVAILDPNIDGRLFLEGLGLRRRCLEETGEPVDSDLDERLRMLTRRTGSRIAANMLARHDGRIRGEGTEDDPLGSLLDRVEKEFRVGGLRRESQRLVKDVLASSYLALLPRMLGFRPGSRAVVLDVEPGAVLVMNGADVDYLETGSSAQVRSFLLALSRSPQSKQQLVEWMWGYRYDAGRHDPLVYALVRRVRRLLGANENWIRAREGRYVLADGVQVHVHDPGGEATTSPSFTGAVPTGEESAQGYKSPVASGSNLARTRQAPVRASGLNHRQILFLEWITAHRFASVSDLMGAFAVSKATATRDLADLVEAGQLARSGLARATRYSVVVR